MTRRLPPPSRLASRDSEVAWPSQHHAPGIPDVPSATESAPATPPIVDITELDLGDDIVFITDRHGTIVEVNEAFVRVTGYSREEAIGSSPSLLSSGLQDQRFYAELWRTILDGEVWEGHIVDRRRDGTLRTHWVTITPVCDDAGRVTHFVAVERDLSADLGDQLGDGTSGLVHTDVTGRCVYADAQAALIFGKSATQLLGRGLLDSLVEEDADAWREAVELSIERGRGHRLHVRTHDDTWLQVSVAPLGVASGAVIGARCVIEDAGDAIETQSELERRDALVDSLLDAFDDPMAVLASDGTVMALNAAWIEAHTRQPDEVLLTATIGDNLLAQLRRHRGEPKHTNAATIAEELEQMLRGFTAATRHGSVQITPLAWEEGGAVLRVVLG